MQRMQRSREVSLRPCCQRKEGAGEKRRGQDGRRGDGTGRDGTGGVEGKRRGERGGGRKQIRLVPGACLGLPTRPGGHVAAPSQSVGRWRRCPTLTAICPCCPPDQDLGAHDEHLRAVLPPALPILPGCTRRPPCLLPNGGRGTKKKKWKSRRMTVVAVTDAVIEEESNGGGRGGRVVRGLR